MFRKQNRKIFTRYLVFTGIWCVCINKLIKTVYEIYILYNEPDIDKINSLN